MLVLVLALGDGGEIWNARWTVWLGWREILEVILVDELSNKKVEQ